jgi:hypothetical protein
MFTAASAPTPDRSEDEMGSTYQCERLSLGTPGSIPHLARPTRAQDRRPPTNAPGRILSARPFPTRLLRCRRYRGCCRSTVSFSRRLPKSTVETTTSLSISFGRRLTMAGAFFAGLHPDCPSEPGPAGNIRFYFAYTIPMSRYDRPSHRVYLSFMLFHGSWHCQFLESDAETAEPRTLNFADPEKIRSRQGAGKHGATWRASKR